MNIIFNIKNFTDRLIFFPKPSQGYFLENWLPPIHTTEKNIICCFEPENQLFHQTKFTSLTLFENKDNTHSSNSTGSKKSNNNNEIRSSGGGLHTLYPADIN